MTRFLFATFQLVILVTTLVTALDWYLAPSPSIWLMNVLPFELVNALQDIGVPGGGAVCPVTCRRGGPLEVLSAVAVVLSARHLWRHFTTSSTPAPSAFGPIERLLAGAAIMLIALEVTLNLPPLLMGKVVLDLFVNAVTLGQVSLARKSAHGMLVAAFWIVELKLLLEGLGLRKTTDRGGRTVRLSDAERSKIR
ncbi:hypothetical protein [Caldimonas brevitalea]|uniref:Uncharacterized protein n=1 Tax=Caldimonas brevitalea TaxID=413882 RepID=A0A0G3BRU4_9BURK|nr:hypothetical protein [Caldimonas brevitalea]AKJ30106.1 hypothetical protein AAW51_3415 [Caldimonas brevitalea]